MSRSVLRVGKRETLIESFGLPLGAMKSSNYSQCVVPLRPGDRILVVSDGIVEAMNSEAEMWGFERLESTLVEVGSAGPLNIIEVIFAQVQAFTDETPQHDDMTMVVLQVV